MNSGGLIHTGDLTGPRVRRSKSDGTGKLISQHYLDIEDLLRRIESSNNHYQVLGLERGAAPDQIILAYQKAVRVLHPSYHKVRASISDDLLGRVDEAFERLSKAFTVLTNHSKRTKYDRSLRWSSYQTGSSPSAKSKKQATKNATTEQAPTEEIEQTEIVESPRDPIVAIPPLHIRPALPRQLNTRRDERVKISVPVLITGYDASKERWQEVTESIDISRFGVAVSTKKRLNYGVVVHVTLPVPEKLRRHGFDQAGCSLYAIVRRVEPLEDGARVMGLEFIGSQPPSGYLHRPWDAFRTQQWTGPDRRREERQERSERVAVEYLDGTMQPIARELAVTENVSLCGARVRIKHAPDEFELVRISTGARKFESVALVRNRYTASDGLERLCLQFVQSKWPIRA